MADENDRPASVQRLSSRTKRTVTINTALTPQNIAKCNPQTQSPLFTKLPPELRDLIWVFASTPDEDPSKPYPETAFHYRPGYKAASRTWTTHLLTCRLAWLEANALLLRQTSLPVWLLRGPHDLSPTPRNWQSGEHHEVARWGNFLKRMTANNIRNARTLHLFTQMFELERLATDGDLLDAILRPPAATYALQPKVVRVTVRQADWWDWELAAPLRLDATYIQQLLEAPQLASVSEVILELETDDSKKDELRSIVETLQQVEATPTVVLDDPPTSSPPPPFFACTTPPRWTHWTRSPRLANKDWTLFSAHTTLTLHIAQLTWRNASPAPAPSSPTLINSHDATSPYVQNTALLTLSDTRSHIRRTRFHRGSAFELGLWRLAMARRHQAAQLNSEQWAGLGFEYQQPVVWYDSVDLAQREMGSSRERFERAMGDFEARRLARVWEAEGSLLMFDGLGM